MTAVDLSTPPFVVIDGVMNSRSLGNYPSRYGSITRPNYAFRSGHISGISSTGKAQLRELGIEKVFDLRADIELTKFGSPPPDLPPEIHFQRIPVFKDEDYSPQGLTLRSKLYASGSVEGILEVYSDILKGGQMAFKSIFEHIRDNPDKPFLFHCTAGKDRTGVLAALVMDAAGCDDDSIARDYELTSIGLEPTRAATEAKFLSFPDFAGNIQAVRNTLGCRRESILAFMRFLEDKFGGTTGYLRDQLGFSTSDITIIRNNLVLDVKSQGHP